MKKLFIILLLSFSTAVTSEPLDWITTEKIFEASEKLKHLDEEHSTLESQELTSFFFSGDTQGFIKKMASMPEYSKVKDAVKSAGLSSLEQYVSTFHRLLAAYTALALQENPDMPSPADLKTLLEGQKQMLAKAGLPPELAAAQIAEMESTIKNQTLLRDAAMRASKADIAFVKTHRLKLAQLFEDSDEEGYDSDYEYEDGDEEW